MTIGRFYIGQIVLYKRFSYLGVIYDVEPRFMQSEKWYQRIALSYPPKDQPWYHVLVDGMNHATYVSERNLDAVTDPQPIYHPLLEDYFSLFTGQCYETLSSIN